LEADILPILRSWNGNLNNEHDFAASEQIGIVTTFIYVYFFVTAALGTAHQDCP